MTNAMISLALTLAIAATLGTQMATTAYRFTAVRATLAGEQAPHVAHQLPNGRSAAS